MKLTKALASWLRETRNVPADATDDVLRTETGKALADGTLTAAKFADLSADPDAAKASALESKLDNLNTGILNMAATFKAAMEAITGAKATVNVVTLPVAEKKVGTPETPVVPEPSAIEKAIADSPLSGGCRVKGAHESYDNTKSAVFHPERDKRTKQMSSRAGQPVCEAGSSGSRQMYRPSELERAAGGAFLKFAIEHGSPGKVVPRGLRMTDHDKGLLNWAFENCKWGGVINGGSEGGSEAPGSIAIDNRKLFPHEVKALIDDTLTGGLEAAPIFFDDAVILNPLLTGELFPRVNLVTITRGRRIEAASFGNVTVKWGGGDDDPTDLYDTTGFISAFDTTIHVVDGAIEIGLDFLSDSPLRVMDIVVAQYSERLLETLDEQIAVGDGAQEPEGWVNATGTVSSTWGGVTSIGNYESLLFGVAKRFKQSFSMDNMIFCGTEQSYQRARALPHGASDARRLFGMDEESYQLFGHPYAINEAMGNRNVFFANMRRYRMYRRLGLTVRSTGEGRELTRKNAYLITARARFGGQGEVGSACALAIDAPA